MVQAKLLRVLETREVLALGALRPQPVKLQICSASHRSLAGEVAAKRLREDLYYRIGRPAERIPPLRERPEEIPWLIDLELHKLNPSLFAHPSLVSACLLRPWPGNVRELLVEVRSAALEALAAEESCVKAQHLSQAAGQVIVNAAGNDPPPTSAADRAATEFPVTRTAASPVAAAKNLKAVPPSFAQITMASSRPVEVVVDRLGEHPGRRATSKSPYATWACSCAAMAWPRFGYT